MYFDGKSNMVYLGDPPKLNFTGQITISAWIKPLSTGRSDINFNIVSHGYTNNPKAGVALRITGQFYQINSWDGNNDYRASVLIPTGDLGSWVHLAGVYDGRMWRLYRNGREVNAQPFKIGAILVNDPWSIGAHSLGGERFFHGTIDEVLIYNRALIAEEVKLLGARPSLKENRSEAQPKLVRTPARHVQQPIPTGKEAKTQDDWRKQWLEYRLAQVELYKKHTRDPAKVHSDAIELIRKANIDLEKLKNDPILRKLLRELADKIKSNGSTDPLVLYHSGIVRQDKVNKNIAISELKEAIKKYRDSTYPSGIRFLAIESLRDSLSEKKADAEFNPYFKEFVNLGLKMLSDEATHPENRRVCWSRLQAFRQNTLDIKRQGTFYHAIFMQEKVDPWIREMSAGTYHCNQAWFFRGGGYANEVKETAWPLFRTHLKIAGSHLKKAWQIDPKLPHSAAKLIEVAMAGGSDESTRAWFDRAVKAQMDFIPAYISIKWANLPRWGGSHDRMQQFGVECASTGRYDTKVPIFFLDSILEIDKELDAPGIAFQKPGVYKRAKEVLEKYADHPKWTDAPGKRFDKSWILSVHVVVAIHAGEFEDARQKLDQLGDRLCQRAFPLYRCGNRDESMVYALTGKVGKEIMLIREMLKKNPQDEATKKRILKQLDLAITKNKDQKAMSYLDYLSKAAKALSIVGNISGIERNPGGSLTCSVEFYENGKAIFKISQNSWGARWRSVGTRVEFIFDDPKYGPIMFTIQGNRWVGLRRDPNGKERTYEMTKQR